LKGERRREKEPNEQTARGERTVGREEQWEEKTAREEGRKKGWIEKMKRWKRKWEETEEKNGAARERCRLTVAVAPREFFFAFD
jgi:hypothetical protein